MIAENLNCIIWPGSKDRQGYGKVKIHGKQCRAHRAALEHKIGRKLLPDELALHSCHNASCVNPLHLAIGTVAENNRQARSRRQTLAKTVLGIMD